VLSLLVFGSFTGVFGALIAVPATALIRTIYKSYRKDRTLDLSSYGMPASDPEAKAPGAVATKYSRGAPRAIAAPRAESPRKRGRAATLAPI